MWPLIVEPGPKNTIKLSSIQHSKCGTKRFNDTNHQCENLLNVWPGARCVE